MGVNEKALRAASPGAFSTAIHFFITSLTGDSVFPKLF